MSTKHVRSTENGPFHVLVVSGFYHRGAKPRKCEECDAAWTVEFMRGEPYVQRNGDEAQEAILDWSGNNVAVQCCRLGKP